MSKERFARIRLHILYTILNAPVRSWPHHHLYVDSVFPAEFYAELRRNMPASDAYTPLAKTGKVADGDYDMRAGFLLDQEHLTRVPTDIAVFWTSLFEEIMNDEFAKALLDRHADDIRLRLKREGATPAHAPGREMILVRDGSSDGVKVHTSDPRNLLTLLFYLPEDDSASDCGTTLYVPRERGVRCWGGPHHEFSGFDEVQTMPYRPNSLFMFVKSDESFHGVKPIHKTGLRRDLLLYYIHR